MDSKKKEILIFSLAKFANFWYHTFVVDFS